MTPRPLYDPSRANPAYQLRYIWSGWPSRGCFPVTASELVESIRPLWETDGLRMLESRCDPDVVQLLFSATPGVSPEHLAARAKGRFDHALRKARSSVPLSRKLAVRSIGDSTRRDVEAYLEGQVDKELFASPSFEAAMREFTVVPPEVDLSIPSASARGRYWYNLHLVLVVERRARVANLDLLRTIRDASFKVATKHGHCVSRLALLPDHLHVALRGNPAQSPEEIAGCYQNNISYVLGQKRIWNDGFYVGTFGEYNMQAVRDKTANR